MNYDEEMPQSGEDLDLLELTDEDGNTVVAQVLDYVNYNGEEYAVLAEYDEAVEAANRADQENASPLELFFMRVVPVEGSEDEVEFQPIEDEKLEDELFTLVNTNYTEDALDDEDEEQ